MLRMNKIPYEDIMNGDLCIVRRTVKKVFTDDIVETVVLARKLVGEKVIISSIAKVVKSENNYGFELKGVFSKKTLTKLSILLVDLEDDPKIIVDTTK